MLPYIHAVKFKCIMNIGKKSTPGALKHLSYEMWNSLSMFMVYEIKFIVNSHTEFCHFCLIKHSSVMAFARSGAGDDKGGTYGAILGTLDKMKNNEGNV